MKRIVSAKQILVKTKSVPNSLHSRKIKGSRDKDIAGGIGGRKGGSVFRPGHEINVWMKQTGRRILFVVSQSKSSGKRR